MADSDDFDLARQATTLEIEKQSLLIGNSILRAEIARLEKQLVEAEASRRKRRAIPLTSAAILWAMEVIT